MTDTQHAHAHGNGLNGLKTLLNQTLWITASDGRSFVGTFAAVDRQKNLILTNTEEFREVRDESSSSSSASGLGFGSTGLESGFGFGSTGFGSESPTVMQNRNRGPGRYVSMVMLPWKMVLKVEVEAEVGAKVEDGEELYT